MKTRQLVLSAIFAAILCVSAVFTIPLPFTPVPITLQVMAVMVCAAALDRRTALSAVGLYLLLGVCGLPVFSGMKSGFGVLLGATGGYLWGFLPAVFLISSLQKAFPAKGRAVLQTAVFMALGLIAVYFFGTLQLMLFTGADLFSALAMAVLPFVAFDAAKIALAVPVAVSLRQLQQKTA